MRIAQNVAEGIEPAIAQSVGDGEGPVVDNFDEARGITFWRHIEHTSRSS